MALVGFDKDEVIDYVPEFCNNRDSDNPCIIKLKFVPYSKVQRYARLIAERTKNTNSSVKIAEASQGVQRKQFCDSVDSIEGYSIGDKEITDAGEFYDVADTDLVIEIIKAMESQVRLTEGQLKNL